MYDAALRELYPRFYDIPLPPEQLILEIAGRFPHRPLGIYKHDKIRVGYLTEGFSPRQAPIKSLVWLAQHHDKDKFELYYFSRIDPDQYKQFKDKQNRERYINYDVTIKELERCAGRRHIVYTAPAYKSDLDRSLWLYNAIRSNQIDILVTYAMATIPHLHFLCAMKPAPVLIKDCLQQAERSILPDVTIHISPQTIAEDTGYCELLPWRMPRPVIHGTYTREDFNVPREAFLFATIGRGAKYHQSEFLDQLKNLMQRLPDVWMLLIGAEQSSERMIGTGIIDDPFNMLCDLKVDAYLDSFPLGGAQSIAEAMFAGLPVVMFDSTDKHIVSQWTMPEIWGIKETIIPRWDHDKHLWFSTCERLVTDKNFRRQIADRSAERAEEIGDYESYVRQREAIYEDTLSKALHNRGNEGQGVQGS